MPRRVFVTGTDTNVGKTVVSVGLMRAARRRGLRVAGMKPVATGAMHTPGGLRNTDALALQEAASEQSAYDAVNPYMFECPIAPHIAASCSGVTVSLEVIGAALDLLARHADAVIVEGAGGWKVPLAFDLSFVDLVRVCRLEVSVVVGLRSGCINHALLTAQALSQDKVPFIGWIANSLDPDYKEADDAVAFLQSRIQAPFLGRIPWSTEGRGGEDVFDEAAGKLLATKP